MKKQTQYGPADFTKVEIKRGYDAQIDKIVDAATKPESSISVPQLSIGKQEPLNAGPFHSRTYKHGAE